MVIPTFILNNLHDRTSGKWNITMVGHTTYVHNSTSFWRVFWHITCK